MVRAHRTDLPWESSQNGPAVGVISEQDCEPQRLREQGSSSGPPLADSTDAGRCFRCAPFVPSPYPGLVAAATTLQSMPNVLTAGAGVLRRRVVTVEESLWHLPTDPCHDFHGHVCADRYPLEVLLSIRLRRHHGRSLARPPDCPPAAPDSPPLVHGAAKGAVGPTTPKSAGLRQPVATTTGSAVKATPNSRAFQGAGTAATSETSRTEANLSISWMSSATKMGSTPKFCQDSSLALPPHAAHRGHSGQTEVAECAEDPTRSRRSSQGAPPPPPSTASTGTRRFRCTSRGITPARPAKKGRRFAPTSATSSAVHKGAPRIRANRSIYLRMSFSAQYVNSAGQKKDAKCARHGVACRDDRI